MKFVVSLAIWIAGCVLFDAVLHLQGPWLMCAGVITYMAQESAVNVITVPS